MEPMPCDAKLSPPLRDLAAATTSPALFSGLAFGTTSTKGDATSGVTGVKSFSGS